MNTPPPVNQTAGTSHKALCLARGGMERSRHTAEIHSAVPAIFLEGNISTL